MFSKRPASQPKSPEGPTDTRGKFVAAPTVSRTFIDPLTQAVLYAAYELSSVEDFFLLQVTSSLAITLHTADSLLHFARWLFQSAYPRSVIYDSWSSHTINPLLAQISALYEKQQEFDQEHLLIPAQHFSHLNPVVSFNMVLSPTIYTAAALDDILETSQFLSQHCNQPLSTHFQTRYRETKQIILSYLPCGFFLLKMWADLESIRVTLSALQGELQHISKEMASAHSNISSQHRSRAYHEEFVQSHFISTNQRMNASLNEIYLILVRNLSLQQLLDAPATEFMRLFRAYHPTDDHGRPSVAVGKDIVTHVGQRSLSQSSRPNRGSVVSRPDATLLSSGGSNTPEDSHRGLGTPTRAEMSNRTSPIVVETMTDDFDLDNGSFPTPRSARTKHLLPTAGFQDPLASSSLARPSNDINSQLKTQFEGDERQVVPNSPVSPHSLSPRGPDMLSSHQDSDPFDEATDQDEGMQTPAEVYDIIYLLTPASLENLFEASPLGATMHSTAESSNGDLPPFSTLAQLSHFLRDCLLPLQLELYAALLPLHEYFVHFQWDLIAAMHHTKVIDYIDINDHFYGLVYEVDQYMHRKNTSSAAHSISNESSSRTSSISAFVPTTHLTTLRNHHLVVDYNLRASILHGLSQYHKEKQHSAATATTQSTAVAHVTSMAARAALFAENFAQCVDILFPPTRGGLDIKYWHQVETELRPDSLSFFYLPPSHSTETLTHDYTEYLHQFQQLSKTIQPPNSDSKPATLPPPTSNGPRMKRNSITQIPPQHLPVLNGSPALVEIELILPTFQ